MSAPGGRPSYAPQRPAWRFVGLLLLAFTLAACGTSPQEATRTPAPRSTAVVDSLAEIGAALEPSGLNTVADVIVRREPLHALAGALHAADLLETLQDPGPFTVFAPTNVALAALPQDSLRAMLQAEDGARLLSLLTYHVSDTTLSRAALPDSGAVPTLQGIDLSVTRTRTGILVNDASIREADLQATNGVVHLIDRVLLPPGTL